jgi:gas vesicle protein
MAANDCFKGLIVGGLIGAALGILYAPKSGKETREGLRNSAEELLEKAKKQYEEAYKKIENLTNREKELYAEKERLKNAVEAGVKAFKQEKADAPPKPH